MFTIEEKQKKHRELLDQIHKLYVTKNHDYGDSVHQTFEKYGMTSYLVRVEDKINRVNTLTKEGFQAVNDEKILDSLLDAANYLILAALELEEDKSERVQTITVSTENSPFITWGSDITTGAEEQKAVLSSVVLSDGKIVESSQRNETYNSDGGVHIYGSRSNSNETN